VRQERGLDSSFHHRRSIGKWRSARGHASEGDATAVVESGEANALLSDWDLEVTSIASNSCLAPSLMRATKVYGPRSLAAAMVGSCLSTLRAAK